MTSRPTSGRALAAALAAICWAAACAPSTEPRAARAPNATSVASDASDATGLQEPARLAVDASEVSVLSGRVRIDGDLPRAPLVVSSMLAGCEHEDEGDADFASEAIHGVHGGVGGAYVAVVAGWQRWLFPEADAGAVRLEQRGCVFRPRLVAVRAGQELLVGNQDDVTHNVHTYPRRGTARNVTQVAGGPDLRLVFEHTEIVPLTCDLHPWMKAFVAVAEHPLFACTAADGSFRIEGVPPGGYTVEVWHEVLGELRAEVRVPPASEAHLDFLYPSER